MPLPMDATHFILMEKAHHGTHVKVILLMIMRTFVTRTGLRQEKSETKPR